MHTTTIALLPKSKKKSQKMPKFNRVAPSTALTHRKTSEVKVAVYYVK
jgi:hypothetical protein